MTEAVPASASAAESGAMAPPDDKLANDAIPDAAAAAAAAAHTNFTHFRYIQYLTRKSVRVLALVTVGGHVSSCHLQRTVLASIWSPV